MTIAINLQADYGQELSYLQQNINLINDIDEETDIKKKNLKQIYQLLNNNELKIVCRNILKNKYLDKFTYEDLNSLYDILENFYNNISGIKEQIDIEVFFEKGNHINITKLKEEMKRLDRRKLFPNFNYNRLEQLFKNPPRALKPLDGSSDQEIIYDPFVVRKYLYGIVQMVVNEMDLLIGYVGDEGMGKSAGCSQDINLMYYLLSELQLIEYEYNLEDMWFNSLDSFLEAEDRFFDQKFRILGLDEGNELHRQNWQDDRVKTFFQRLRRERFNQRIKFICLPQLGELLTGIVLSRMNFIFHMRSKNKVEIASLEKGFCDFYIIPRGDKIYSPAQKRNITKEEVKTSLGLNIEDKKKKFVTQLPKSILIKTIRKNGIWGFNRDTYNKSLKQTNKLFTVSKGVKLTEYQAYCYFKARPNLKNWFVDRKEQPEIYATLQKMDKAICRIFEEDPQKLEKFERMQENKEKRRIAKESSP